MSLLYKPLINIDESDLEGLKGLGESRQFEFKSAILWSDKEALKGVTDQKKRIMIQKDYEANKIEFLADISSFLNAEGGEIYYGLTEDQNAKVNEVSGLDLSNESSTWLRLYEIIRRGLQPVPPTLERHFVSLNSGKKVLIIRIPKSWLGPHRIAYNSKFYSRHGEGKQEMDVDELRSAFLLSSTLEEKIRGWHRGAISRICQGKIPTHTETMQPKASLHVIPYSAFYGMGPKLDYKHLEYFDNQKEYHVILDGFDKPVPNLDGWISSTPHIRTMSNPSKEIYLQFFRNGIIESVHCNLYRIHRNHQGISTTIVHGGALVHRLSNAIERSIRFLKSSDIPPPYSIFLTLNYIDKARLEIAPETYLDTPFDRPDIILEQTVPTEEFNIENTKLLFDQLWNACGQHQCDNFSQRVLGRR